MPNKKHSSSAQSTAWSDFRSRRTEELKREYPNQSGTDRQEQIREEWKVSDENPKAGK
ncbi:hypothetical protein C6P46_006453 [Rhodotorula mucilaginosa]|uniref:Coiled-coil domain-containing protein n=1 Tax=Rhodotorula mucilaginosa TaxID=5537 RepID=A0A9P7B8D7_RHOMI|nr:hypothetical protein C6P46_006453 [Rhodotorula mucilaginosa]